MRTAETFWSFVHKTSSCWFWQGARCGRITHKYGSLNWQGRGAKAHRVAWELVNGPIPTGMGVLHRCDVTLCVNPDHLFLGDQITNMRDCAAKGRNNIKTISVLANAAQRAKTHCPSGHPYSGDNLKIGSRGERLCRACGKAASARHYNNRRLFVHSGNDNPNGGRP